MTCQADEETYQDHDKVCGADPGYGRLCDRGMKRQMRFSKVRSGIKRNMTAISVKNGVPMRSARRFRASSCVRLMWISPGYIALTAEGKYEDAINLIRRDNPFPTACAMICEHPCEERCRRNLIDSPVNIRGIKKFAVDQIPFADRVKVPPRAEDTGKVCSGYRRRPERSDGSIFSGSDGTQRRRV